MGRLLIFMSKKNNIDSANVQESAAEAYNQPLENVTIRNRQMVANFV
jgi:hypothetical protein